MNVTTEQILENSIILAKLDSGYLLLPKITLYIGAGILLLVLFIWMIKRVNKKKKRRKK